jgi:FkbM family methyltransferase
MSDGFNQIKETRHGRMLYNINDEYVGRSLDLYGEYSEGEIDLFSRVVAPGDIVLDIGANIGAHTIWLAKATLPDGAVIAYEPQRYSFQSLCANLALNSITNAIAFWQAVGEQPGRITVPIGDPRRRNNFGGLELGKYQQGDQVVVVRIDDLGLPRCKLMKVDVEGMELAVLKGAAQTIARLRPVLYVEDDRPSLSANLQHYIASLGYDMYWHYPPLFNPDNFFGNRENVFGKLVSKNLLCVPAGVPVNGLTRVQVSPG